MSSSDDTWSKAADSGEYSERWKAMLEKMKADPAMRAAAAGALTPEQRDAVTPMTHIFVVKVEGNGLTSEQAAQVMAERICYDEDYGFDYKIDFQPARSIDEMEKSLLKGE